MGTRGAYGFRIDGQDKLTYNHFDSYPDCLGADIVEASRKLLGLGGAELSGKVRAIKMIDGQRDKPTDADKKALHDYTDLGVSKQSDDDWYCLTRGMQGDIEAHVKAGIMLAGGSDFMRDSLFCEWAYIVNLDDKTLEVYRGFQKEPHDLGRYAKLPIADAERRKESGAVYYPVALVATFPLDDIPTNWKEQADQDDGDET